MGCKEKRRERGGKEEEEEGKREAPEREGAGEEDLSHVSGTQETVLTDASTTVTWPGQNGSAVAGD